jgi:hypothetical protein
MTVGLTFFLIAANFSSSENRFECSGKVTIDRAEAPKTAYLKLQRYRWWVALWSDSQGSAWLEIPNTAVYYFGFVTEAGDQLLFWDSTGGPSNYRGAYSPLSGALSVRLRESEAFSGSCKDLR